MKKRTFKEMADEIGPLPTTVMATGPEPKNIKWWALHFVHNCVIHPIIPFADVAAELGATRLAGYIYIAHDETAPY